VTVHTLAVAFAIAAGVWVVAIVALYAFGRPRAARELVTLVPNLLRLFRGLMKDPRVPRRGKVFLAPGSRCWWRHRGIGHRLTNTSTIGGLSPPTLPMRPRRLPLD
jgi:hypothetical protein